MKTTTIFLIAAFLAGSMCAGEQISLEGPWRFELDRNDVGVNQRWFARTLAGQLRLPGTLAGQGIGDEITLETPWIGTIVDKSFFTEPEYAKYRQPGQIKVPFWLQPDRHYVGAAWYQRDIEIPETREPKSITLFLERPHWETRVWVDEKFYGSCTALGTPHEYDLGTLTPGRHTLTLRVDNRMVVDVGENSHSISDHTQGNWNGIVGRLELVFEPLIAIRDLQVDASRLDRPVVLKGRIANATRQAGAGQIEVSVRRQGDKTSTAAVIHSPVSWSAAGGDFQIELSGEFEPWDEFNPALYEARVRLGDSQRSVVFGRRELTTRGTQFLLNGRKLFLRGTLECAIFPATGYPPVDTESWKRIIRTAKAHGLNHFRFHSWCPPEAAFTAADELGFYYHVECSSWANNTTTLGDGKPVDKWIYEEADRILKSYGNHPSFLFLLYGNEPGGDRDEAFLSKWVSHYRAKDPRRLYSSGAGWPLLPENQFHVTPEPRIQHWGAGLKSRINSKPPETQTDYREYIQTYDVPVVSHEIGQWCVYPNFDEISKYRGYLKPKNFEIFRDRLADHGMVDRAKAFLLASGKLQAICYKEEIESALRTKGMGGFQLLSLHDFPGQGTALVGVLDPFWDSKGYVTPEEFARFCGPTVVLARMPKRVYQSDEAFEVQIEVAHFGPRPLAGAAARWEVRDDRDRTILAGELTPRDIPIDNGTMLGKISLAQDGLPAPGHFKLAVRLTGTPVENDWDFWVYPPRLEDPAHSRIRILSRLDQQNREWLESGGTVLLVAPPETVIPDPKFGKIELGFSSIFWNTAWTKRQAPHTLGILCDPGHPALSGFPTEFHSNWQWWYLLHPGRSAAMILDGLPAGLQSIVQVIDDWFTARKLGLVFEAKVGKGKLLVSSIDLETDLELNPVARQLRRSLLDYMTSDRFAPQTEVTAEQLAKVVKVF
ncbi:MAG TPA: glycoside hydrolase family 2 TIM barrel-domain containing protein [Acidobacteriota bacterium]|nr:glycoside hydrolase family 2 TIM barrel-domain containing protein [Acidobacteriota bacterium]